MKLFKSLTSTAKETIAKYEKQNLASFAAAQEAIGGILILDGFIGIDNPLGGKKRPGIFGTLIAILLGIVFMFIPTIFGNMTGMSKMTANTQATVTDVNRSQSTDSDGNKSISCTLSAKYRVNGQDFNNSTSYGSSSFCSLSPGQSITIDYNPNETQSWGYATKQTAALVGIFFWAGLFVAIAGLFTFVLRLLSIIFGWILLQRGRKLAATLPKGANIESVKEEIKKSFLGEVFNGGGIAGMASQLEAQIENPNSNNTTQK